MGTNFVPKMQIINTQLINKNLQIEIVKYIYTCC